MLKISVLTFYIGIACLLWPFTSYSMEGPEISSHKATQECPICLEPMLEDQKLTTYCTPCNHTFHENCIKGWLKIKQNCPLCRREIPKSIFSRILSFLFQALSTSIDHDLATNYHFLNIQESFI